MFITNFRNKSVKTIKIVSSCTFGGEQAAAFKAPHVCFYSLFVHLQIKQRERLCSTLSIIIDICTQSSIYDAASCLSLPRLSQQRPNTDSLRSRHEICVLAEQGSEFEGVLTVKHAAQARSTNAGTEYLLVFKTVRSK